MVNLMFSEQEESCPSWVPYRQENSDVTRKSCQTVGEKVTYGDLHIVQVKVRVMRELMVQERAAKMLEKK